MAATTELVMTRVFEAPRELVWKAWTDPEHFGKWWGPKPYTSPINKIDLRVGGTFLWSMRSPEGETHFNAGVFTELEPPARLACDIYFSDEHGNKIKFEHPGFPTDWNGEQKIYLTLEDLGGRTRLMVRQTGIPEGDIRKMAAAGWSTSLDKLHESLVDGRCIVQGRVFDAPRELVWEAWTNPEHAGKWWGPDGFVTKTKEHDLRVGGLWRHDMIAADGTVFPNRTEFLEIVEPERLVYLTGDDENYEWFRATVTFMEFAGQTHVNMISVFPDIAILDKVVKEHGAIEGGKQHLKRLAEYLAKLTA
jgi:uncharacterized protein YndB with AHSA1/START domain